MRHLLAFSLCFASTILATGDEIKRSFDLESDLVTDDGIVRTPDDLPSEKGGAKGEEASEWRPRLMIMLNANKNVPMTKIVKERVQVSTQPNAGSQLGGSVTYRDVERRALAVSLAEITTLYCDTVTMNVLEDGDTSSYSLECKSRVCIWLDGVVVEADSASLIDGKCELVNATLTRGVLAATAQQLTLTVPIHGVSTSSFGRPIPEKPPAVNLSSPPTIDDRVLRPEPDPLSTPTTY